MKMNSLDVNERDSLPLQLLPHHHELRLNSITRITAIRAVLLMPAHTHGHQGRYPGQGDSMAAPCARQ